MIKIIEYFMLTILLSGLAFSPSQKPCSGAEGRTITISFVGDVHSSELPGISSERIKTLKSHFKGSDIVFGNLESPLTNHSGRTKGKDPAKLKAKKDFILRSSPEAARFLKKSGFTVMGLANNHIMDFNETGLRDTLASLNKAGISHCGAGLNLKQAEAPVIVKAGGAKAAFIAYSEIKPLYSVAGPDYPGIAGINYPPSDYDLDNIKGSIKKAKKAGANIVVVSLHWGKERSTDMEEYQERFARKIIDAGADCIIGHHPHVLRRVDTYKGKTIAYSLGNYIFPSADRDTVILKIKFRLQKNGTWKQEYKEKKLYIKNGIPG